MIVQKIFRTGQSIVHGTKICIICTGEPIDLSWLVVFRKQAITDFALTQDAQGIPRAIHVLSLIICWVANVVNFLSLCRVLNLTLLFLV